jgi:hypothetical protein
MTLKYQLFHSLFFTSLLLGSSSLHADWILIDDFEGYEAGTYNVASRSRFALPLERQRGAAIGQMDIFTGIEGTGGEKAAWFWYRY